MTGNLRPSKAIRYLAAIMCISLLGSLSGNSFLIKDAKAQEMLKNWALSNAYVELVALRKSLASIPELAVPVGTIMPYGGSMEENKKSLEEKGWYYCNSESLNKENYSDLFAVIGTAFGSKNGAHFNLPDLRGRFVRGVNYNAKDNNVLRDPDADSRIASAPGGKTGDMVG